MQQAKLCWKGALKTCLRERSRDGIEEWFFLNQIHPFTEENGLVFNNGNKTATAYGLAYKKRIDWFSERCPSLRNALSAMSSAPAMALPSFPPSRPLADDV